MHSPDIQCHIIHLLQQHILYITPKNLTGSKNKV